MIGHCTRSRSDVQTWSSRPNSAVARLNPIVQQSPRGDFRDTQHKSISAHLYVLYCDSTFSSSPASQCFFIPRECSSEDQKNISALQGWIAFLILVLVVSISASIMTYGSRQQWPVHVQQALASHGGRGNVSDKSCCPIGKCCFHCSQRSSDGYRLRVAEHSLMRQSAVRGSAQYRNYQVRWGLPYRSEETLYRMGRGL